MFNHLSLLSLLFFSAPLLAFSLLYPNPHRFEDATATIHVTSDHCEQIGLSKEELHQLTIQAAQQSWGKGDSSSLTFVKGRQLELTATNLDNFSGISYFEYHIPHESIVVGCTKDLVDFEKHPRQMLTSYVTFTGKHYVLLNDSYQTGFWELNKTGKTGALIHHLGHAIGLGHSEAHGSLMFHYAHNSGGDNWNVLYADDLAGLEYLYPKQQ